MLVAEVMLLVVMMKCIDRVSGSCGVHGMCGRVGVT